MKKLTVKLILFLAITIALNNLFFNTLQLPYCWGNNIASQKNAYLLKHGNEYNTLFIGTSKTYVQTDVELFDSLTNHRTRSFNFGIEAAYADELYYYTDNLIKANKNIKYVFLEVYDVNFIIPENLHTSRLKYCYNLSTYLFSINSFWHTDFGLSNKLTGTFYSTVTFLEWLIKPSLLKPAIDFKYSAQDDARLGKNRNGFLPYDGYKALITAPEESRKEYLSNTAIDGKEAVFTNRILASYNSLSFNRPYYNKLNKVISGLQNKGVTVFLIIAPRTYELHLANIVPPFMKINTCPKINLLDPRLNPEFYNSKYVFDAGHLNYAGSVIYTERIAKAFNEEANKK